MEKKIMTECWRCTHKKDVPGNAHVKCDNPDLFMTGNLHGIKNGWFNYPELFDPIWKTKACDNFEEV